MGYIYDEEDNWETLEGITEFFGYKKQAWQIIAQPTFPDKI